MSNRRQRAELRKSEWFTRWRVGKYRQEITYLKKQKKPSNTHPMISHLYDFRAANLRKAKLPKADLRQCNFNEAQMYQVYLVEAKVSRSELLDTDLCYSKLAKADFSDSNLTNARLKSADLSNAILTNAVFVGAELRYANLAKAKVANADFSLSNLSGAKGLELIIGKPKSVDGATIDSETWKSIKETSLGKMLEESGAVLNLDYKYDIAISYADEDREIAERIAGSLKKMGIRVFFDKYEVANLWGKNLYSHLIDVYKNKAKFGDTSLNRGGLTPSFDQL